jgi:KaiC/GvpD/RAD55 family RecA-like ATPase
MSGDDFLDECKHYNAEKNFNPTIFGDVQCPRGTLSYIGARPGGGKTTAMVNVAREALDSGRKVIFVNLEMLNREITTNLCLSYMFSSASEAQREILIDTERPKKVFYSLFREGVEFRNKDFITLRQEAINKVTGLMNRQNLVVFNGMGRGLSQLLSNIRDLADAKGDFKEIVVIVDYIQRMPTDENKKVLARWLEMKESSNRLLGLAVKKELVIIAGAQFNREKTEDDEADLENFAESSDIARDAYNAIRIDRDGLGIKILKARDGCKRDSFPLTWAKPYFFMQGPNEAMLQKLEKILPKIPMNRDPEIVRQNTVRHILDPNARDPITGLTDDEAEYILLRGVNENDGKEGKSHARKNKKQ